MTESKALVQSHGAIIRSVDDLTRFASVLASSGYFRDARDAAQAAVKIQLGAELGVGPVASMTGVHIVEGRPALSAGLIASLIKRSGRYDLRVRELSTTSCTLDFVEAGKVIGSSTFTLDDARAAGLAGRGPWKTYPRNMLYARALTNGARWYCPDVFHGAVYTPDELDRSSTEHVEVAVREDHAPAADAEHDEPKRLEAPKPYRMPPELRARCSAAFAALGLKGRPHEEVSTYCRELIGWDVESDADAVMLVDGLEERVRWAQQSKDGES